MGGGGGGVAFVVCVCGRGVKGRFCFISVFYIQEGSTRTYMLLGFFLTEL